MTNKEKYKAIAMSLMTDIRETAARFIHHLPKKDREDWKKLAEALRKQLSEKESENLLKEAITRMVEFK